MGATRRDVPAAPLPLHEQAVLAVRGLRSALAPIDRQPANQAVVDRVTQVKAVRRMMELLATA